MNEDKFPAFAYLVNLYCTPIHTDLFVCMDGEYFCPINNLFVKNRGKLSFFDL